MFVNMGPVLQNFKSFLINMSHITENDRISALMAYSQNDYFSNVFQFLISFSLHWISSET